MRIPIAATAALALIAAAVMLRSAVALAQCNAPSSATVIIDCTFSYAPPSVAGYSGIDNPAAPFLLVNAWETYPVAIDFVAADVFVGSSGVPLNCSAFIGNSSVIDQLTDKIQAYAPDGMITLHMERSWPAGHASYLKPGDHLDIHLACSAPVSGNANITVSYYQFQ